MPPASAAVALWKAQTDVGRWEGLRARHADLQRHHGVASGDAAKLERLAKLDAFVAGGGLGARARAPQASGARLLLVELVEWKLLRGKWRPALMGYAKAQTDAAVADAMKKAIAALGPSSSPSSSSSPSPSSPPPPPAKARAALDALCSLRGVGPATASIVLCAATCGHLPYMGDEALEAVLGARNYKADEYLALAAALQKKASELRTAAAAAAKGGGGKGRDWTAEDVQRALHAAELEARAGAGAGGGGGGKGAAAGKGKTTKQKEEAAAASIKEAPALASPPKRQRLR